jgi:glycyl-tRNA synthetase alpha subunit
MVDVTEIACKCTRVALQDAAHLYLSEDHVAQMIMLLRRDPAQGRVGRNGFRQTTFYQFQVQFEVHFGADRITVYLLRIKPTPKKPGTLIEVLGVVKELSMDVLKSKVKRLIDGGND